MTKKVEKKQVSFKETNHKALISFERIQPFEKTLSIENKDSLFQEASLDSWEMDVVDALLVDESAQQLDWDVGLCIHDQFVLTSKLGEGAMGQVFGAWDKQAKRQVAIKCWIHQAPTNNWSESIKLFQRDAALAAQIDHPNVIRIHYFGLEDSVPFIVMEYVKGQTLFTHLNNNCLSNQDIRDILTQLLDAVSKLHQLGLTHRDIKPSNIMVDQYHHIRLLDFGVATLYFKLLSSEKLSQRLDQLIDPTVAGTPAYMAPEQWDGDNHACVDVWAIGVVLYQMMMQSLPFKTMDELQHAPIPNLIELYQSDSQLAHIVEFCLQRNAKKRFQNAGQIKQVLNSYTHQPNWVYRATIQNAMDVHEQWHNEPLVLYGEFGSGKTTSAKHWGWRHSHQFERIECLQWFELDTFLRSNEHANVLFIIECQAERAQCQKLLSLWAEHPQQGRWILCLDVLNFSHQHAIEVPQMTNSESSRLWQHYIGLDNEGEYLWMARFAGCLPVLIDFLGNKSCMVQPEQLITRCQHPERLFQSRRVREQQLFQNLFRSYKAQFDALNESEQCVLIAIASDLVDRINLIEELQKQTLMERHQIQPIVQQFQSKQWLFSPDANEERWVCHFIWRWFFTAQEGGYHDSI